MKNIKLLFFGSIKGKINKITVSQALDDLASKGHRFLENRENCLDIDDIFDNLQYDLEYLDLVLSVLDYNPNTEEYKCPIYQYARKIGLLLIDKHGSVRLIYDKLQATSLDPKELERQIQALLTSSKMELIDTLMGLLQFTRPIPLSSDVFLLSISNEDEAYIMDFFDQVFARDKMPASNRPYFINIQQNPMNFKDMAGLVANKMSDVLNAFQATKDEYYRGLSPDMTQDDISIINKLIELTEDDIDFYESKLRSSIRDKLSLNYSPQD